MEVVREILKKIPVSKKFTIDLSWNVISFGVMGVSGILLNVLIAKFYNVATLGVFNQLYALYILLSQLSVFGIHFSMLKNISHYNDDTKNISIIFSSGIYIVCFTALIVILVSYCTSKLWLNIFHSTGVKVGFIYILPALFFFSLNKTYLAFHNAFRRMKAYAAFQATRFLLFLIMLVVLIIFAFDGFKLALIFTLSEFFLFLILFFYTLKYVKFSFTSEIFPWIKKHLFLVVKLL